MKVAEQYAGQQNPSLPFAWLGYGVGLCLTALVCVISGADLQAGLTLTLVVAFILLASVRLEWGVFAILTFAVVFIDGWAPTRSPEDVPFRLGIARLYIVEFGVYGLLGIYLLRRAFGKKAETDVPLFASTPLDAPLMAFAALMPAFAVYGLLQGNPVRDSLGYFEWRSLFLAIPFYYLVTTLFDTRAKAMRLATWVFALIAIKSTYYLIVYILQLHYPLPDIIGAGPMDEGPENVMFVFATLAGVACLMFKFGKFWRARVIVLPAIVVLLANLLISAKRSVQLGFAVGLVYLFWRLPARQKVKIASTVTAVLLSVVLLVGIFRISTRTVEQSASRYDEIFQFIREPSSALSSNGTLAFHILDLVDAWNIIIQRPVLGYGFGSHYDRKLTLIEGAGGEDAGLEPGIVHDLYLHIWWKAGIPGLAIFCWLLVRFFRFGAASMAGPPSSPPQAIALGLYSAMWGDLAMELWGPQWFASTKVALVIFCSFALIVRLVQPEQNAQIASPVGLQPAEPDFGGS